MYDVRILSFGMLWIFHVFLVNSKQQNTYMNVSHEMAEQHGQCSQHVWETHTHYSDASNSAIITLGKPELLTTGQVGAYKHQHTTCLLGCPGLTFTGISRYVAADDKHKQWPLNCVQAASLLVLIKQIWDRRYMTSTTWLWPLSLINVCFPG